MGREDSLWWAIISKQWRIVFILNKFFFLIKSLHVNQEKLLIVSFPLFPCLCVSLLFKSLVEIKIEIKCRLHCIDIYDNNCSSAVIIWVLRFYWMGSFCMCFYKENVMKKGCHYPWRVCMSLHIFDRREEVLTNMLLSLFEMIMFIMENSKINNKCCIKIVTRFINF